MLKAFFRVETFERLHDFSFSSLMSWASESPCSLPGCHKSSLSSLTLQRIQACDANPVSPLEATSFPLRAVEISPAWPVTRSLSHFLNVSWKSGQPLSLEFSTGHSVSMLFNLAAHKLLVRGQRDAFRPAEVSVLMWAAGFSLELNK